MDHRHLTVNGASLHVTQTGQGPPLVLLHGWPEIALTWEPVMQRLAGDFTLLAPDLRGFGDSAMPDGPFGAADHARDILGLMDALGLDRAGIVGHDVGGAIMQALARAAPERMAGLFFFDFVYPGIGARMGAPDRLAHIWYQSFHQLPLALDLVGASRETCRAYIGHFLRHWAFRTDAFDDVIERFVDAYAKPGRLAGGFAYYQAAQPGRIAMMKDEAPTLPPIRVPTCVRWAEHDPLFPIAWTDRLGETFADCDYAPFPGVGHFPHREAPEQAAVAIDAFFARIGWRGAAATTPR